MTAQNGTRWWVVDHLLRALVVIVLSLVALAWNSNAEAVKTQADRIDALDQRGTRMAAERLATTEARLSALEREIMSQSRWRENMDKTMADILAELRRR